MSDGFYIPLRDGQMALVRPVYPTDQAVLAKAFSSLSDDTKYDRFLSPIKNLSAHQLAYFTNVDQVNHVAWGVGIPQESEILGIAIGRYVRLEESPTVAEFALTVNDPFQGKGLGTFLLALLYRLAQRQGDIETLRGVIGGHNERMLSWMRLLGASVYMVEGSVMQADIGITQGMPDMPENRAARRFCRILELIKEGEARFEAGESEEGLAIYDLRLAIYD